MFSTLSYCNKKLDCEEGSIGGKNTYAKIEDIGQTLSVIDEWVRKERPGPSSLAPLTEDCKYRFTTDLQNPNRRATRLVYLPDPVDKGVNVSGFCVCQMWSRRMIQLREQGRAKVNRLLMRNIKKTSLTGQTRFRRSSWEGACPKHTNRRC